MWSGRGWRGGGLCWIFSLFSFYFGESKQNEGCDGIGIEWIARKRSDGLTCNDLHESQLRPADVDDVLLGSRECTLLEPVDLVDAVLLVRRDA